MLGVKPNKSGTVVKEIINDSINRHMHTHILIHTSIYFAECDGFQRCLSANIRNMSTPTN